METVLYQISEQRDKMWTTIKSVRNSIETLSLRSHLQRTAVMVNLHRIPDASEKEIIKLKEKLEQNILLCEKEIVPLINSLQEVKAQIINDAKISIEKIQQIIDEYEV